MAYIPEITPASTRYVSFWIMCGLPGTGKTTTCKKLVESYGDESVFMITRDTVRTDLLWEMRKKPELCDKICDLDNLVTEKVLQILEDHFANSEAPAKGIIIDGCHTEINTLRKILNFIAELTKQNNFGVIVNLVLIGSPHSICHHALNNHKEGDYSDYKGSFHNSLPKSVFERKRKEFEQTYTAISFDNNIECDFVWKIPAYKEMIVSK